LAAARSQDPAEHPAAGSAPGRGNAPGSGKKTPNKHKNPNPAAAQGGRRGSGFVCPRVGVTVERAIIEIKKNYREKRLREKRVEGKGHKEKKKAGGKGESA